MANLVKYTAGAGTDHSLVERALSPLVEQAPQLKAKRAALELLENRCPPAPARSETGPSRFLFLTASAVLTGAAFLTSLPIGNPISYLCAAGLGSVMAAGGCQWATNLRTAFERSGADRGNALRRCGIGLVQIGGIIAAAWAYGETGLSISLVGLSAAVAFAAGWLFVTQDPRSEAVADEIRHSKLELAREESAFANAMEQHRQILEDQISKLNDMAGLGKDTAIPAE